MMVEDAEQREQLSTRHKIPHGRPHFSDGRVFNDSRVRVPHTDIVAPRIASLDHEIIYRES